MIKHLVKHGDDWALVIDRSILELLKIDLKTPLEISTEGRSMTIVPVDDWGHAERVRAARAKVNAKYSQAFKKLAE